MTTGIRRRNETADSLVGAAQIQPTVAQAPQLAIPNEQVPDVVNSQAARVGRAVGQWASKKWQDVANVQHEAAVLDGQMAYQQGKTIDELKVPGDKWAMSGYRVMQAQTMSASMLAAQREMIRQSEYEKDPEQFRADYIKRAEAQLKDLDPQTAKMVREQIANQMPNVVAEQTSAYMQNEEKKAFDTLSLSVDALSKDSSQMQALIENAKGGASGGLSHDRRTAALVDGVAAAFENGNPLAYQQLKQSGVLDSMSRSQKAELRAAEQRYENKVRTTYNAEHQARLSEWEKKSAAGEFKSDEAAVEALSKIWGIRNVTITAAEGKAAYTKNSTARLTNERTDLTMRKAAIVRGDWKTYARLTEQIVIDHESGGDPNAESWAGAKGLFQVMDATAEKPGYGIRPSDGTPQDRVRVGREYWRAMMGGKATGHGLNWEPMDTEAAAVAYNAGPAKAIEWINAGRDYSVIPEPKRSETEPYAKSIKAAAAGKGMYYTASEKYSMAQNELKTAETLRNELLKTQQKTDLAERTAEFGVVASDLRAKFNAGKLTQSEYTAEFNAARKDKNLAMTTSLANDLSQGVLSGTSAAIRRAESLGKFDHAEKLAAAKDQIAVLSEVYKASMANPALTPAQAIENGKQFRAATASVLQEAGATVQESDMGKYTRLVGEGMLKWNDMHDKWTAQQTRVDAAIQRGDINSLSTADRKVADKRLKEDAGKLVSNAVAKGEIPAEQQGVAYQQALMGSWLEAGAVDKGSASAASAALGRQLVDDKGNPSAEVVQVLKTYQQLLNENPDVADTLFTDERAKLRAKAMLSAAGGQFTDDKSIASAVQALNRDIMAAEGSITGNIVVDQSRVISNVSSSVDSFFDSMDTGFWQAMSDSAAGGPSQARFLASLVAGTAGSDNTTTEAERKTAFSPETKDEIRRRALEEAVRLEHESPNLPPEVYAKEAVRRVTNNLAVIGGSVLVSRGKTLRQQMFGEAASSMTTPGVENKVVLSALNDLKNENPEKYGYIGDTTFGESAGGIWRAGVWIADAVAAPFGGDVQQPAMSATDAASTALRGVRPFIALPQQRNADGQLMVRMLMPDGGYGPVISLDLKSAGEKYRKKHINDITDE